MAIIVIGVVLDLIAIVMCATGALFCRSARRMLDEAAEIRSEARMLLAKWPPPRLIDPD